MSKSKQEIDKFLKELEGTQSTVIALEKSDGELEIKAVKDTLVALRKVSPDLIDSKIYERLSRLVDTVQIAEDTQKQVERLTGEVKELQTKTTALTKTVNEAKQSLDILNRQLRFEIDSQGKRNIKLGVVLEALDQYLRRFS